MFKYSIIMPVYNSENVLEKSIGSIIGQTYKNWELIAVNDGSSDSSLKILEQFKNKDSRIHILNQENMGPGAARNYGISMCTGEYIAFLDSDDYWEKDFLELMEKENTKSPLDIIFIEVLSERTDGTPIGYRNIYQFENLSKYELLCNQITGKISWGMGKVIKRMLIKKENSFTKLNVGEEAIFSFDVLYNAQSIGFIKKPVYHYVQSISGQHKKGNNDPWKPIVESVKNHLIDLNLYGDFEDAVNSFALRSLCICLYRCSCNYPIRKAVKLMKIKYNEYCEEYNFSNLNLNALDKNTRIIFVFLKIKLFTPVYIASVLRKKKQRY